MSRIVCQFSCGAASAVATKLAIAQYGKVEILNAYVKEEHPDNRRFLTDCESWFGQSVTVLRDERYGASVIEVFRRKQFMKSRYGAPCTAELKRKLLDSWRKPDDIMIFGYTAEEEDRFEDFKDRNPDKQVLAPLIERGLGKKDCLAMLERAGIELPMMYRLGYSNANCIGCVKGGEGYFRAIREDFPEQFETLCQVQESIGPGAYLFRDRKTNVRYSLRDIPPGKVRRDLSPPECGLQCEIAEQEYAA
ncbi:hypothetical protein G7048_19105 [Diaphorobacter sp. HDW4B]|uniref:hypothetical protein n=1 Tax=Diaphorobacter sp. HDW4B TaxID=2714925 RepID=UPI001409DBB1|nr:hypothetical protein [Diaphorobacter sp. HDW4B]QIL72275.1 hypothetical protein G7048_19105 [Diaphorobacter sp. HDW4B]